MEPIEPKDAVGKAGPPPLGSKPYPSNTRGYGPYRWEAYVPAHKRSGGYYTVLILYGDTLCGRADPRYDRGDRTLRVLGLWLEAKYSDTHRGLAMAVGRGLARLLDMTSGERLDLTGIPLRRFRTICTPTANPSH